MLKLIFQSKHSPVFRVHTVDELASLDKSMGRKHTQGWSDKSIYRRVFPWEQAIFIVFHSSMGSSNQFTKSKGRPICRNINNIWRDCLPVFLSWCSLIQKIMHSCSFVQRFWFNRFLRKFRNIFFVCSIYQTIQLRNDLHLLQKEMFISSKIETPSHVLVNSNMVQVDFSTLFQRL